MEVDSSNGRHYSTQTLPGHTWYRGTPRRGFRYQLVRENPRPREKVIRVLELGGTKQKEIEKKKKRAEVGGGGGV